ncbi:MAG TPA: TIGR03936 family radical SAM-associated protein [Oscillospiraceae bacterium]|nr:TIGR03936 family radical SAM-associated protein [Oscillospiraceae bacterium]
MNRLLFRKTGRAIYLSHLDLMRTFPRAFLRAGLAVKHTEGYNPHAFLSIALPLPLGQASDCELLDFQLLSPVPEAEVPFRLNAVLPEGLEVLRCCEAVRPVKEIRYVNYRLEMLYDCGAPSPEALSAFFERESLVVTKKAKKTKSNRTGFAEADIRPLIRRISFEPAQGGLLCHALVAAQNPSLNPEYVMKALSAYAPELRPDFVRYRRTALLDADERPFA